MLASKFSSRYYYLIVTKIGEAYIGSPEQTAFDIVAATSLGIASSPFLGAAAIALGIEQRDFRVFFRQGRIGKNGERFDIFKLRTIPGQDHSGQLEVGGSEHPRASLLGKIVRKAGIDELPQSINVLRRDIHFVGVRTQVPITMEQRHDADPVLFDEWSEWAKLNPGFIGPGQELAHLHPGAYTESSALISDVMRLDVIGCENASLSNDIACLARTPTSMVRGIFNMLSDAH